MIFCIIVGTIGHFAYKISNNNKIIGFLFSQDESTWEHLKLGITPIFIFSTIEFIFYKNPNIIVNNCLKITTFSILIIILYYFYKHITKKNIMIIDIIIFYISLTIAHIVGIKHINTYFSIPTYIISIILNLVIVIGYFKLYKKPSSNFLCKNQ